MLRATPLLLAATLLLAGCSLVGLGKAQSPAPLQLRIDAAERLNPDDRGHPLPTLVRLYQLTSASRARSVELVDLLRDPKEALGGELLAVEEILLSPGQTVDRVVAREKETRAVLVAAVVRRPAGETWRDVVELPGAKSRKLSYLLEEYRLSPR